MFVSSSSSTSSSSWPSHRLADCGFIHFLLVRPFMFVSRDVSRCVDDVFAARLPLPAARRVEALLVRTRELGGVRQSAHGGRGYGSLRWGFAKQGVRDHLWDDAEGGSERCRCVSLTVTPAMMGDFPSISLKTSDSASSALFSLYFFLASSASATLNSSYVMLRQDFFLEVENGEGAVSSQESDTAATAASLFSLWPLAQRPWEPWNVHRAVCKGYCLGGRLKMVSCWGKQWGAYNWISSR